MKLLKIYGEFVDSRGDHYLCPLKLKEVKKLNGREIEASVLLRLVDGVKAWSRKAAK